MASITVLIPARNAQNTLAQTLESLASQTLQDFDVLLVNDASSDNTVAIAESFAARIAIRVLTLPENLGVAGALNAGLATVNSTLIARIDADDLALPTRFERQLAFLQSNPNVDVCSSWMEMFYDDENQSNQLLAKPLDDASIKTALIQYCALSHPSTMMKKSFFDDVGFYDVQLDFAEDYDLWCRGALLGKCYANLPEALTMYRKHNAQVGQQKRQLQYERDLMIKRKYISALLGDKDPGYLAEFFSLLCAFNSKETAIQVIEQSFPLLLNLSRHIGNEKMYSEIVSGCIGRHLRA